MVGKKFNEAARKTEGIAGDVWQHRECFDFPHTDTNSEYYYYHVDGGDPSRPIRSTLIVTRELCYVQISNALSNYCY